MSSRRVYFSLFRVFSLPALMLLTAVFLTQCAKFEAVIDNRVTVSTTPSSNATNVPVDTTIQATFNEKIDSETLTKTTFYIDDGGTLLPGIISYEELTATFKPSATLNYNYIYIATLSADILPADLDWNFSGHTWSFTTESKP